MILRKAVMEGLTNEDLCDLMCGGPDPEDTIDPREILCYAGYEDAIVFDSPDFDSAIIGVTDEGPEARVIYDYEKMVEQLQRDDGISREEAIEFIEYNTIRAMQYIDNPPVIMYSLESLQ